MNNVLLYLAIFFGVVSIICFLLFLYFVFIHKERKVKEVIIKDTMVKAIEEEKDVKKIVKFKGESKDKIIIHYSSLDNPFIALYYYEKGNLIKNKKYILNDYQIEDGKIVNIDGLAKIVNEDFDYECEVELFVSSSECFKNVVSLPKIRKSKANVIFNKELKENFKDYKNDYTILTNNYSHSLGYIYNTYFIPNSIVENIRTLAYLINSKVNKVDLFGNYIFNLIKDQYDGNYSVIFKDNDYCLFLNVYNNNLTTIHTISTLNIDKIIKEYLLIVSKHEFEFERENINKIYASEEICNELSEKLGFEVEPLKLNLNVRVEG